MARRYSPSEIRIPWICVLKREFPDLIPLQRISTKQVQACAYRITLFERGVFDHAVSLSLSLFFLMKEAEGCFPAKFLPVEKIRWGGEGREERKKRGKEETTRDFLHTIRITGSPPPSSRASSLICFSFRLSYSFRLPLFPPSFSFLFHRFISLLSNAFAQ